MDTHQYQPFFHTLIAIVAVVMGVGFSIFRVWTSHQRKKEMLALHHKERLLAIEHGRDVPPLPPEFFQDDRRQRDLAPTAQLRHALFWLFGGVALTIALALNLRVIERAAWGLIPIAIGLAHLAYYLAIGRHQTTPPAPQPLPKA